MATTAQGHTSVAPAIRAGAENYTALNDLIGTNKELVMQNLVETYGDQGITGMLKMTGAISSGGSADQVEWFEASRRHKVVAFSGVSESNDVLSFTIAATNINKYDVFMDANAGTRYIAQSSSTSTTLTAVALSDDAIDVPSDTTGDLVMLGNMYPQGSDQPSYFVESEVTRKKNPFAIVY